MNENRRSFVSGCIDHLFLVSEDIREDSMRFSRSSKEPFNEFPQPRLVYEELNDRIEKFCNNVRRKILDSEDSKCLDTLISYHKMMQELINHLRDIFVHFELGFIQKEGRLSICQLCFRIFRKEIMEDNSCKKRIFTLLGEQIRTLRNEVKNIYPSFIVLPENRYIRTITTIAISLENAYYDNIFQPFFLGEVKKYFDNFVTQKNLEFENDDSKFNEYVEDLLEMLDIEIYITEKYFKKSTIENIFTTIRVSVFSKYEEKFFSSCVTCINETKIYELARMIEIVERLKHLEFMCKLQIEIKKMMDSEINEISEKENDVFESFRLFLEKYQRIHTEAISNRFLRIKKEEKNENIKTLWKLNFLSVRRNSYLKFMCFSFGELVRKLGEKKITERKFEDEVGIGIDILSFFEEKDYIFPYLRNSLAERLIRDQRKYENEETKLANFLETNLFPGSSYQKISFNIFRSMINDVKTGVELSKDFDLSDPKELEELMKKKEKSYNLLIPSSIKLDKFSVKLISKKTKWPIDFLGGRFYEYADSGPEIPRNLSFYTKYFWEWFKKKNDFDSQRVSGRWILNQGNAIVRINTIKIHKKKKKQNDNNNNNNNPKTKKNKEKEEEELNDEEKKLEDESELERNSFVLDCSTIQMFILLCFNKSERLLIRDIKKLLRVKIPSSHAIMNELKYLCIRNTKNRSNVLLRKARTKGEVDDGDMIVFNNNFKDIGKIDMKRKVKKFAPDSRKEQKRYEAEIGWNRKHSVDTFIYHYMKKNKRVDIRTLLLLLVEEFKSVFKITFGFGKRRIESMREREYIKRDRSDYRCICYCE